MKLSTESIVAGTVALVFSVFLLGAIAREQGDRGHSSAIMPALNQVTALGPNSPSSIMGGTDGSQLLAQY